MSPSPLDQQKRGEQTMIQRIPSQDFKDTDHPIRHRLAFCLSVNAVSDQTLLCHDYKQISGTKPQDCRLKSPRAPIHKWPTIHGSWQSGKPQGTFYSNENKTHNMVYQEVLQWHKVNCTLSSVDIAVPHFHCVTCNLYNFLLFSMFWLCCSILTNG